MAPAPATRLRHPTAATTAATAGGGAGARAQRRAQGHHPRRLDLLVAEGQAPIGLDILAAGIRRRDIGIALSALRLAGIAAILDRLHDIEGLVRGDDDVVAAAVDGIAGMDRHIAVAVVADDLEPANDTP